MLQNVEWSSFAPSPMTSSSESCSNILHQIIRAKTLVEEGTKAWKLISQNNDQVQWESVVFEIEEQFMKIACCKSRSLTQQHGSVYKLAFGPKGFVVVSDPIVARHILRENAFGYNKQ